MSNNDFEKVIITIKVRGSNEEYDFEVDSKVTVEELLFKFNEFLSIHKSSVKENQRYIVMVETKHDFIDPTLTIEEAGLWEGSILILTPV
ncbi:MAG: hypothetical protein FJW61_00410 [Actinobacteria bacterium]|nr:hypothetical protein [Actinomycetota bacterium]